MATISQGQGCLRSNFAQKVSLTPSNVPTKFCRNNQNRVEEKCKNAIADPKNGNHFPRSKFVDKVLVTPNNVTTKFVGITKIDWEKSAKKCDFFI